MFEVPVIPQTTQVVSAPIPTAIQAIQKHYSVSVTMRPDMRSMNSMDNSGSRQTVIVRGSVGNVTSVVQASTAVYELITGQRSVSLNITVISC